MCNLSKGVEENGIRKGIVAVVSTLKELQIADEIILSKIREKFGLTEETAETYLKEIILRDFSHLDMLWRAIPRVRAKGKGLSGNRTGIIICCFYTK